MENRISDYNDLKKGFVSPKNEYRPIPVYALDGDITDEKRIAGHLTELKKSGCGGVMLCPTESTLPKFGSEAFFAAYSRILECAARIGLYVIFCDDSDEVSGSAGGMFAEVEPASLSKQLRLYEVSLDADEPVHRKLRDDGVTLSVVAFEIDTHEVIDLREHRTGEYIDWNPPHGNWNLQQYVCTADPSSAHVNYLDYDACHRFISHTYKQLTDRFPDYAGEMIGLTYCRGIHFVGRNHRMWDADFNKAFIELFDFDPAPYYPALYFDIGEKTGRMRAMFMNCRAYMLEHGFFKAIADFTMAHGLRCAGTVLEPKSIAPPWLSGDGMGYQKLSGACAVEMSHAYGYGINALKLASGAACNYDKELVVCDIYGGYEKLNADILRREAMNSFARGANCLVPRLFSMSDADLPAVGLTGNAGIDAEEMTEYNRFVARAQYLLRGGRHVTDIALLYPIYSLEAQTTLFETQEEPASFEYPTPPPNADYMNVINILMNYCCRDLTVLHPDTLNKRCFVEDNALYLSNPVNSEKYRLVILPATSVISIRSIRKLHRFFDAGGKIIATGELPSRAFEYGEDAVTESIGEYRGGELYGGTLHPMSPDEELAYHIKEIFGVDAGHVNDFEEYYYHQSAGGGDAYFLPSSQTVADGTEMPDARLLGTILNKLNVAFDVECDEPPRILYSGILNVFYPTYRAIHANAGFKSGGLFNYIHRRAAGCDVYYFSNSTNTDYRGTISLRGSLTVEEWDPHTGAIRELSGDSEQRKGEVYTKIQAEIPSASSRFYICRNVRHEQPIQTERMSLL